jgi:hypothetical protein
MEIWPNQSSPNSEGSAELRRKRASHDCVADYDALDPAFASRGLSLAGTAWPTELAERADQKSFLGLRHNRAPTEIPDLQPFQPPEQ